MSWKYEDMLYLPHPVSSRRAAMPMEDRAAKFSPYAALTGHEAVIRETARLVDQPVELTESRRNELNRQLMELDSRLEGSPLVEFTHYVPDSRKAGGAYVVTAGRIRRIDSVNAVVVLMDGTGIEMDTITDIHWEGEENREIIET